MMPFRLASPTGLGPRYRRERTALTRPYSPSFRNTHNFLYPFCGSVSAFSLDTKRRSDHTLITVLDAVWKTDSPNPVPERALRPDAADEPPSFPRDPSTPVPPSPP